MLSVDQRLFLDGLQGYYRLTVDTPVEYVTSTGGIITPTTEMVERADTGWGENLVVDAAYAGIASRINGHGSEAAFTFAAVGTTATAAAAGDTTLGAEITDSGMDRSTNGATTVGRSASDAAVANGKCTWTIAYSVTGSKTIGEAGILNANSAGILLSHKGGYSQGVVNGETLNFSYTLPTVA